MWSHTVWSISINNVFWANTWPDKLPFHGNFEQKITKQDNPAGETQQSGSQKTTTQALSIVVEFHHFSGGRKCSASQSNCARCHSTVLNTFNMPRWPIVQLNSFVLFMNLMELLTRKCLTWQAQGTLGCLFVARSEI